MNKRCTILIGPPGSGKSTLAKKLMVNEVGNLQYQEYFSFDSIREELYGDANIQGGPEVYKIFSDRLAKAIERMDNVIVDNTSVKARSRREIITKLPKTYTTVYEVLLTPLAKCLEQNSKRKRVVPEEVIRSMANTFKHNIPLLLKEGPQVNFHLDGKVYIDHLPEGYKYEV